MEFEEFCMKRKRWEQRRMWEEEGTIIISPFARSPRIITIGDKETPNWIVCRLDTEPSLVQFVSLLSSRLLFCPTMASDFDVSYNADSLSYCGLIRWFLRLVSDLCSDIWEKLPLLADNYRFILKLRNIKWSRHLIWLHLTSDLSLLHQPLNARQNGRFGEQRNWTVRLPLHSLQFSSLSRGADVSESCHCGERMWGFDSKLTLAVLVTACFYY